MEFERMPPSMMPRFQFLIGIAGFVVFSGILVFILVSLEKYKSNILQNNFPEVEYCRTIKGELLDTRPPASGLTLRLFYSIDCPIATDQILKLRQITNRFSSDRLLILAICVDPEVTDTELLKHADDVGLNSHIIRDKNQDLARKYEVRIVPDWILTDSQANTVYRGSLDGQYADRSKRIPGEVPNLLLTAIENWFGRRSGTELIDLSMSSQRQIGCPLPLVFDKNRKSPDYANDVAPILKNNCVGCHRPGQSGPFALTSYESAAKRADDIVTVVEQGLMPPWKPERGSTPPLTHERGLLAEEKTILRRWAENGMPKGTVTQSLVPVVQPEPQAGNNAINATELNLNQNIGRQNSAPTDWPLGPPDLVLSMSEPFMVPAGGPDIYRCFVLPTGLSNDVSLSAVDVRPGNPKVVHHVFNYIDVRGIGKQRDCKSDGPGYDCFSGFDGDQIFGAIGGWTPGNQTRHFGEGVGLRLPANSDIVMQVHYHPIGTVEKDQTRIGLYFNKGPIKKSLQWLSACENSAKFKVNAGARDMKFETTLTVPMDVHLHAFTPHMHLLGRSISTLVHEPDGTRRSLIQINDWDFNQQDTYYLREPLLIRRGSTIVIESRYDNSTSNPLNPNRPPKDVRWGEASTDEMMILFLALTKSDQDLTRQGEPDNFMEEFFKLAK